MKNFEKGDQVKWNWGDGHGTGEVREKYTSEIEKSLQGSTVKRNASEDNPAYLIQQGDGDEVLKSGSELSKA